MKHVGYILYTKCIHVICNHPRPRRNANIKHKHTRVYFTICTVTFTPLADQRIIRSEVIEGLGRMVVDATPGVLPVVKEESEYAPPRRANSKVVRPDDVPAELLKFGLNQEHTSSLLFYSY